MPNWCYNYVCVTHENPAKIAELKQTIVADEPNTFAHFIPLPDGKWDYDFCVDNWGTKWEVELQDVTITDDGKTLSAFFSSAWSPPIEAYCTMHKQGFKIHALYSEQGMGFCGIFDDISYQEFPFPEIGRAHV